MVISDANKVLMLLTALKAFLVGVYCFLISSENQTLFWRKAFDSLVCLTLFGAREAGLWILSREIPSNLHVMILFQRLSFENCCRDLTLFEQSK